MTQAGFQEVLDRRPQASVARLAASHESSASVRRRIQAHIEREHEPLADRSRSSSATTSSGEVTATTADHSAFDAGVEQFTHTLERPQSATDLQARDALLRHGENAARLGCVPSRAPSRSTT